MQQCTTEDVIEVILPHLTPSLSTWQYLSARVKAMSSSMTTDSPAAVAADDAKSDIDIAVMLSEYAALQHSVQSFCDYLLERSTPVADSCSKIAEQSPEKDPAANSGVPNDRDFHPQNGAVVSAETRSVPDGIENTNDPLTDRGDTSSSEKLQNMDSSVDRNSSGDVSSMQQNGDPSDCGVPSSAVDRDCVHIDKFQELNGGESTICGNTEARNFHAPDGNKNPATENFRESCSNLSVMSERNSETTESNTVLTSASEKLDNGELPESDSRKDSCGTVAMYSADTDAIVAEKPSSKNPAVELCSADNIVNDTELPTLCSGDTLYPAVTVIDNMLEVIVVDRNRLNYLRRRLASEGN